MVQGDMFLETDLSEIICLLTCLILVASQHQGESQSPSQDRLLHVLSFSVLSSHGRSLALSRSLYSVDSVCFERVRGPTFLAVCSLSCFVQVEEPTVPHS